MQMNSSWGKLAFPPNPISNSVDLSWNYFEMHFSLLTSFTLISSSQTPWVGFAPLYQCHILLHNHPLYFLSFPLQNEVKDINACSKWTEELFRDRVPGKLKPEGWKQSSRLDFFFFLAYSQIPFLNLDLGAIAYFHD